jgi:hypothetical protein
MSFFKKLTQKLLSSFLASEPPAKKRRSTPNKLSKPAAKAKKQPAAAVKKLKNKSVKAQKKVLKARNTKKEAKPKGKAKMKSSPKGKGTISKGGGGSKKKGPEVIPGTLIAHVTHFFPQVNAAAMKIESGTLEVGNEIYFKGATTNFKMKIDSMQINRVPVTSAGKGAEIGILSKKRVREGDAVYKLP